MMNALLLVGAMLLPCLIGWAVLGGLHLGRRMSSARDRRERLEPLPLGPPFERIVADVRRLNSQREDLSNQEPGPGRGLRTQALSEAYVDALTAACRALDVEPPQVGGTGRGASAEIARVESELWLRGLDVEGRNLR